MSILLNNSNLMSVFARFRILPDNDKVTLVRKLVRNGTPDFDYFCLIGLSTTMATLGLLLDSSSIVIGSMLIAPLMYPLLGVSLGFITMGQKINLLQRALMTLVKSLGAGLGLSIIVALIFTTDQTLSDIGEVMSRTDPNHLHFMVALVAGAAIAYVMAKPEWGETLPGVAIAVALLPPLATVGIGVAHLDMVVMRGASVLLALNILGIVLSAMAVFLLMNLSEKHSIIESTIKREDQKNEDEKQKILVTAIENQSIKNDTGNSLMK